MSKNSRNLEKSSALRQLNLHFIKSDLHTFRQFFINKFACNYQSVVPEQSRIAQWFIRQGRYYCSLCRLGFFFQAKKWSDLRSFVLQILLIYLFTACVSIYSHLFVTNHSRMFS